MTNMLADILTKPLGGELFHNIVKRVLGMYLSNRGAKKNMSVVPTKRTIMPPQLEDDMRNLNCSNHTYVPRAEEPKKPSKKHP
jgi:hypothetical protein